MGTPINTIEDFGPGSFPLQRVKFRDEAETRHDDALEDLKHFHHYLVTEGDHESDPLFDPQSFKDLYVSVAMAAGKNHCRSYNNEIRDARAWALENGAFISDYCSNNDPPGFHLPTAALQEHFENLCSRASENYWRRRKEIADSTKLFNRQLIMHAFKTSSLSSDPWLYAYKGKTQGFWEPVKIRPGDLQASVNPKVDGLYHLTLSWIPSHQATHYPVNVHIARTPEGSIEIEKIYWAPYENLVAVKYANRGVEWITPLGSKPTTSKAVESKLTMLFKYSA